MIQFLSCKIALIQFVFHVIVCIAYQYLCNGYGIWVNKDKLR